MRLQHLDQQPYHAARRIELAALPAFGAGELPAALIVDAVTRLLPGALGNEASSQNESFAESASSESNSLPTGAQHSLGRARDKAAPLQGPPSSQSASSNQVLKRGGTGGIW